MTSKIIMDSAGDLQQFSGAEFACVPLRIMAGEREFVDDSTLNLREMVDFFGQYKGKATTACPGVGDYLEAFGDAENVYCTTITSGLSGSYNAAEIAAKTYKEQHPERKIHVFDSLSTGPEMALIAEKIREMIKENCAFETIVAKVSEYQKKTHLMFSLESLHNLANNGRVPVAVAKIAGILGIRLLGKASDAGTLQPTGKARGDAKVAPEMLKSIISMGYNGGKIRIAHCFNEIAADSLRKIILDKFPKADISVYLTGGLCSFYAEKGGLLVGFET